MASKGWSTTTWTKKPDIEIKVPDEMVKAADTAISHARGVGRDLLACKIRDIVLEAALQWLHYEWETASNSKRIPDLWYGECRKKWKEFSSQWSSQADIPFPDLLIFFGNRFNERFIETAAPKIVVPPKDTWDFLWSEINMSENPSSTSVSTHARKLHNEQIVEAYRRGQMGVPDPH